MGGSVNDFIDDTLGSASDFVADTTGSVADFEADTIGSIADVGTATFDTAVEFAEDTFGSVTEALEKPADFIGTAVINTLDSAADVIHSDAFAAVVTVVIKAYFTALLGTAASSMMSGATAYAESIPAVKAIMETETYMTAVEAAEAYREVEEILDGIEQLQDNPVGFLLDTAIPSVSPELAAEAKDAYESFTFVEGLSADPDKFLTDQALDLLGQAPLGELVPDLGIDISMDGLDLGLQDPEFSLGGVDLDLSLADFGDVDFGLDLPTFDLGTEGEEAMKETTQVAEQDEEAGEGLEGKIDIAWPDREQYEMDEDPDPYFKYAQAFKRQTGKELQEAAATPIQAVEIEEEPTGFLKRQQQDISYGTRRY